MFGHLNWKNTDSISSSSRGKVAILRISLSSNEKSSLAISHNLVVSSLFFEEFLERKDWYEQILDASSFEVLSN